MEKKPNALTPCSRCGLVFFCCNSHRDFSMPLHTAVGEEGLSQCDANLLLREDYRFQTKAAPDAQDISWAPKRLMSQWKALHGSSWNAEYRPLAIQETGCPDKAADVVLRAATDGLTMPLTVLYALEHLAKEGWQQKKELNIHVGLVTFHLCRF
jgi:splicing suppressor protein 51